VVEAPLPTMFLSLVYFVLNHFLVVRVLRYGLFHSCVVYAVYSALPLLLNEIHVNACSGKKIFQWLLCMLTVVQVIILLT
jgi:hypothetical protein